MDEDVKCLLSEEIVNPAGEGVSSPIIAVSTSTSGRQNSTKMSSSQSCVRLGSGLLERVCFSVSL